MPGLFFGRIGLPPESGTNNMNSTTESFGKGHTPGAPTSGGAKVHNVKNKVREPPPRSLISIGGEFGGDRYERIPRPKLSANQEAEMWAGFSAGYESQNLSNKFSEPSGRSEKSIGPEQLKTHATDSPAPLTAGQAALIEFQKRKAARMKELGLPYTPIVYEFSDKPSEPPRRSEGSISLEKEGREPWGDGLPTRVKLFNQDGTYIWTDLPPYFSSCCHPTGDFLSCSTCSIARKFWVDPYDNFTGYRKPTYPCLDKPTCEILKNWVSETKARAPPPRSLVSIGGEQTGDAVLEDDLPNRARAFNQDGTHLWLDLPVAFRSCSHNWNAPEGERIFACARCGVERKIWINSNSNLVGKRQIRPKFPALREETCKVLHSMAERWKIEQEERREEYARKSTEMINFISQPDKEIISLESRLSDRTACPRERGECAQPGPDVAELLRKAKEDRERRIEELRLQARNTEYIRRQETVYVQPVEVVVAPVPEPEPEVVQQHPKEEVKVEEEIQEQISITVPAVMPSVTKLPLVGRVLGVEKVRKRVTSTSVEEKNVPCKRRKEGKTDGRGQFSPWGWLQCKLDKERVYKEEPPDQTGMPVMPEKLRRWLLMKDARRKVLAEGVTPVDGAPKMPDTLRQWMEAKNKEFVLPDEPEPPDIPPLEVSEGHFSMEKTTVGYVVLPSKPVPPDIPLWRDTDILPNVSGGRGFVDVFVSYTHPPLDDPVPPDIP